MRAIAAIALGLFAFGGCASAPERRPVDTHIEIPGSYTSISTAPDSTLLRGDWWSDFGDTALSALVAEALVANYDIRGAVARADQAASIAGVVGAEQWPQLGASGNASRQQQNFIGLDIPGVPDIITSRSSSFGASANLSWEIDLFSRIRKGESAARADYEAARVEVAAVRLAIAARVARSYFAMVEAREQVELAGAIVESFGESAEYIQRGYRQGVRGAIDVRLALSSLESARALLDLRKLLFDTATRQLEILLGRYPGAILNSDAGLPAVAAGTPVGLPSDLMIRRPDLVAAERRFAASEARVSQSRRAFFPRISLTGAAGTLSTALADITSLDFGVWSIAAGVTQPIFQGGRLRASLAQSHAVADQMLVGYVQTLLTAFAEVETALVTEHALEQREGHIRAAAEQSQAARKLAERQYVAGLVDYVTLLEAQRQAFTAQVEHLTVRRQRLDARVNLYAALGGGFELGGSQ